LKLPSKARSQVRQALAEGGHATVKVVVNGNDVAGNPAQVTSMVKATRPRAH
jgi:hypothetical protein